MEISEYRNHIKYQTIEAAVKGDEEAINKIINHYGNYIKKLSTIKVIDEGGYERQGVDVYLSRILELHLITAILKFKVI
ncbi:MAG: helix-turn-helix domain-containing protein [Clostridiales bacterium]|nr:helix-turn-helix domain-containing protein [Clostridiales bacterium]